MWSKNLTAAMQGGVDTSGSAMVAHTRVALDVVSVY